MTTAEIEALIPLWKPEDAMAFHDPWGRRADHCGTRIANGSALLNQPDLGWALARRLATSRSRSTLLNRAPYRWIRAAVDLLRAGNSASRRLEDVAAVVQAREIFESDMRPIVNAALMARDATPSLVAHALALKTLTVSAYDSLFFNVLARKDDQYYLRRILGSGESQNSLIYSRRAAPNEEEALLQVGFAGTVEDVLRQATSGRNVVSGSVEELKDRLLRGLLTVGVDWMESPNGRRQAPPAVVTHAIDFVKKSKSDPGAAPSVEAGMSMGEAMRSQLEADAGVIRAEVAREMNQYSD